MSEPSVTPKTSLMSLIPTGKDQWLSAALRALMALFVVWFAFPFIWTLIISPYLVANDPPYLSRRPEPHIFDLFNPLVYLGVLLSLGVGVVALSKLCLAAHRSVAWFGIGLVLVSFVLGVAFGLPEMARAREKPVIYLYPETEVEVNVKLHYDGILTHSYPAYPDDGWNVLAKPSGELVDLNTGREHYCLFWEGEDEHAYSLRTGCVVEGANTVPFLEESLSKLGLSEREANEFIIYWLPRMEKNRFNVIHFATDEYDRRVPLEITPAPDTLIRVFMVFKALDAPIEIEAQEFRPVERTGFTVVEWGGTELR